jgi:hypothetical protein
MSVSLKPGLRLRSVTCTTEVIVVKGSGEGLDLRCGGEPMVPLDQTPAVKTPVTAFTEGTQIGKRYVDKGESIEVLCTKAGEGSLSLGDDALLMRGAKPLPSSD